jgi:hypothetical protein
MEEDERYTEVCKPAFARMEQEMRDHRKDTRSILNLLQGENGNPGMVDDVRNLKLFRKGTIGTVAFLLTTVVVQFVAWVRSKLGG